MSASWSSGNVWLNGCRQQHHGPNVTRVAWTRRTCGVQSIHLRSSRVIPRSGMQPGGLRSATLIVPRDLDGRTRHGTVRAEYTAVARNGTKRRSAPDALVADGARELRQALLLLMSAVRTSNDRRDFYFGGISALRAVHPVSWLVLQLFRSHLQAHTIAIPQVWESRRCFDRRLRACQGSESDAETSRDSGPCLSALIEL